jgi:hypothetical protein
LLTPSTIGAGQDWIQSRRWIGSSPVAVLARPPKRERRARREAGSLSRGILGLQLCRAVTFTELELEQVTGNQEARPHSTTSRLRICARDLPDVRLDAPERGTSTEFEALDYAFSCGERVGSHASQLKRRTKYGRAA